MKSPKFKPAACTQQEGARCQFSFSDGRQCTMSRWSKHRAFCLPHAREEQRLLALDQVAVELTSLSGEFKTVSDVNHVLGKVFTLFATNRLARRDAVAFAYMGQLLLQSIPGVRREIREHLGADAWDATVEDALAPPEPQQGEQATAETETENEFDGMAALRQVFSEQELTEAATNLISDAK